MLALVLLRHLLQLIPRHIPININHSNNNHSNNNHSSDNHPPNLHYLTNLFPYLPIDNHRNAPINPAINPTLKPTLNLIHPQVLPLPHPHPPIVEKRVMCDMQLLLSGQLSIMWSNLTSSNHTAWSNPTIAYYLFYPFQITPYTLPPSRHPLLISPFSTPFFSMSFFDHDRLVANSFHRLVLDNLNVDTFLYIFAPWCAHCKAFEATLHQLSNAMRNDDTLQLARIGNVFL